jgi:hypothetical protein
MKHRPARWKVPEHVEMECRRCYAIVRVLPMDAGGCKHQEIIV